MTALVVNGKAVPETPVVLVVAPYHGVPNLPPGYYEVSRWKDDSGATVIRCWPQDRTQTVMKVPS